ncbi:hypothetical protein V8C42DRAFT_321865 [Trichoderma barbatum]
MPLFLASFRLLRSALMAAAVDASPDGRVFPAARKSSSLDLRARSDSWRPMAIISSSVLLRFPSLSSLGDGLLATAAGYCRYCCGCCCGWREPDTAEPATELL